MSYIVNVHYKSDPEDLFWQYSGISHTCLHDAVNELISAQKQPHIDKAVVAGPCTGQPVDTEEILNRAISDAVSATENVISVCEKLAHVPIITSYGSAIYATSRDLIDHSEVRPEEIIHELERVIQILKEVDF